MNKRLLILPVLAAAAAAGIWWNEEPAGPACTWRIGTGAEIRQGTHYERLPPETPFRLSLHTAEAMHVYVFSNSAEDGTLLLWPTSALRSDLDQPLPAGHHVLPGSLEGKELAWTTRTGIRASTTFVVVAAREPIPELEAFMPRLRHWTNTVFPEHTMLVTNPPTGTEVLRGSEFPTPLLLRAARYRVTEVLPNGPLGADPEAPGVWYGSWTVVEERS
jgi:hypothetical protein